MLLFLFLSGLATGTLGGALGIGGGIVLTPVLLYLPGGLGLERLDMRAVAALTIAHSFSSCTAGTFVHRRLRNVHVALALTMGITVAVVSFAAALVSRHIAHEALTLVFVGVAVLAAAVMAVPNPSADRDVHAREVGFDVRLAVVIAVLVGLLGGLVGQGGAFLVVPAMLYLLHIPTRVTVGTSLAVASCAAAAGLAGKVLSGQLKLVPALVLATGALLGSSIGASLSPRVAARRLRLLLAVVLWVTAVRMAVGVLG